MKTGRPIESDVAKKVRAGEQIELWPGQWGGKNWAHAAFQSRDGIVVREHHAQLTPCAVSSPSSTRSASATSVLKICRRRVSLTRQSRTSTPSIR
jgi:hypothetical protein